VFQALSQGRSEALTLAVLPFVSTPDELYSNPGTALAGYVGNAGADPTTDTLYDSARAPAGQLISSGGGAARDSATNQTVWNAVTPAVLYNHGGDGSGTANGSTATGFGGGGGGSARQNADATSGAGGDGAMIVRYYRGRVSPFQVVFESSI
jgi:hypothetical protein